MITLDYNEVVESNRRKWKYEDQVPFMDYVKCVQQELQRLNFTPTPEQLDFILHLDDITLVDSTAGSGKTTTIVTKSIIDEVIWKIEPYNIVFLTFSRKSAEDMRNKRDSLMSLYNSKNSARMSTLHSLCYSFLSTYFETPGGMIAFSKDRLIQEEMFSFGEISDDDSFQTPTEGYDDYDDYGYYGDDDYSSGVQVTIIDIMREFIEGNKELDYINSLSEMRNIMSCFAYQKEKLLSDEDIVHERIFQSLQCKPEDYFKLFKQVEDYKKMYEYFDFTDLQLKTLQILREHRDFFYNDLTFQTVFKPIKLYVDEVQDMTPLQKQVIKELVEIPVSSGIQTSLVCIGDGDQTIYTWRGSETLEFESFQKTFDPEGKRSVLKIFSKNHRCGSAILDKAKSLVEHNTLRNPKDMKSLDRKGRFDLVTYTTTKEMVRGVTRDIKQYMDENGRARLENIAVVYREHMQGMGLVTSLLRNDIPFNLSGQKLPFKHWIFKNLLEMCRSLLFDDKIDPIDCIYRFTPLNKKQAKEFKEEKEAIERKTTKPISWIDLLEERSKKGIKPVLSDKTIGTLRTLSKGLKTDGVSIRMILERLYALYQMHNLGYVLDRLIHVERAEIESIELFISSIEEDEDYLKLMNNIETWEQYVGSYQKIEYGVKLMTLHATKGLEFERVYVIGVDGEYLPKESYALELNPKNRKEYIEEERRLLYVGITRAIEECKVYASLTKPSLFLTELDPDLKINKSAPQTPTPQRPTQAPRRTSDLAILDWISNDLYKEELKWFHNRLKRR